MMLQKIKNVFSKRKGVLHNTKTYLIGAMQYGDGRSWRKEISTFLKKRNIVYFDPYRKPLMNAPHEDENTHWLLNKLMAVGDFETVASHFKKVRAFDLSMVDKSDFIICVINPDTPTFGTMEELSWAVRMKKPIFLIIEGGKHLTPLWIMGMLPHKYIYSSLEEVKQILEKIDDGEIELDSDRWRLFKPDLR